MGNAYAGRIRSLQRKSTEMSNLVLDAQEE